MTQSARVVWVDALVAAAAGCGLLVLLLTLAVGYNSNFGATTGGRENNTNNVIVPKRGGEQQIYHLRKRHNRLLQVQENWNVAGHKQLTDLAADMLLDNHGGQQNVMDFNSFWSNADFRAAVYLGLKDADKKLQYTGGAYQPHFYNPDTKKNFVGIGRTAVDMGRTFMGQAVLKGSVIVQQLGAGLSPSADDWAACGYDFGLALHFETDLAQPMHAANFGEYFGERYFLFVVPWDHRHTEFEGGADTLINAGYLDDTAPVLDYDELSPVRYNSVEDILIETAVNSKFIFDNEMEKVLPRAGQSWNNDDIKKLLDSTMKDKGVREVARFLGFFAREIMGGDY